MKVIDWLLEKVGLEIFRSGTVSGAICQPPFIIIKSKKKEEEISKKKSENAKKKNG